MKNKSLILGLILTAIVAGVIYVSQKDSSVSPGLKLYSDSENGFSFAYPSNWLFAKRGEAILVTDPEFPNDSPCEWCAERGVIIVYSSSAQDASNGGADVRTFAELIEKFRKDSAPYGLEVGEVTIGNQVFYVKTEYGMTDRKSYWTEKNGRIYEIAVPIYANSSFVDQMNEIVFSFKLL